jgi:8-hydroxy-5-deazaflavin:NADPH oxidoreductase
MKIGIIGAGFVARGLSMLARKSGHEVMLSNSRGPKSLYTARVSLGCEIGTTEEAIAFGDIVVIAIPFDSYSELPIASFDGKIVIDAGNYHPRRDGEVPALLNRETTTSEITAALLPNARIVKAFNAILAIDMEEQARADSERGRALPIAGDDPEAKAAVARLHQDFGFIPYDAGSLKDSWRFERAKPAYCARLDTDTLIQRLAEAQRNVELPDGHWTDLSIALPK